MGRDLLRSYECRQSFVVVSIQSFPVVCGRSGPGQISLGGYVGVAILSARRFILMNVVQKYTASSAASQLQDGLSAPVRPVLPTLCFLILGPAAS